MKLLVDFGGEGVLLDLRDLFLLKLGVLHHRLVFET